MDRLDKELTQRKLVPSRAKAKELIEKSLVEVNGNIITKANYMVNKNDEIKILSNDILKYVSRGGLKLEKALKVFEIDLKDKVVLDIGSSTGGFTDCALKNGAKKVLAIDVGTNVMVDVLKNNPKVELHENTNFKDLSHEYFNDINFIVCDVSFISIKKIIEKIYGENVKIEGVFLIKPQFECGKEIAKKMKGIILDKKVHKKVIEELVEYFNSFGFYIKNITYSPIKGTDGNIEYLVYISNKVTENIYFSVDSIINETFN